MIQIQPLQLLGGLTSAEFLAEYWQKKPLLIKDAIANFTGLLSPNELAGLACEDDVQARLITHKKNQWAVKNGPFSDADFTKLPAKDWTLLVQSVNHHLPEAAALLTQFNFIPHARMDDLMVSYAPDGGGVGPHFDSYDVFLLQGSGKRLWRISHQHDLSVIADAPLRILQQFETAQEWLLEAGDMLYLPPHLAHWGVAVGEDCMTYSIGFRAPKHDELAYEFLGFMQDQLNQQVASPALYSDADLTLQTHPAQISEAMVKKTAAILNKITWNNTDISQFLGRYLSEPKPEVFFAPNKKINFTTFDRHIASKGLALDLKSQLLFVTNAAENTTTFFMNGEAVKIDAQTSGLLKILADERSIAPLANSAAQSGEYVVQHLDNTVRQQLFDWYLAGYLVFV